MRKLFLLCLSLTLTLTVAGHGFQAKAAGGNPVIKLATTMGEITLELDAEKAPVTTENFVQYVKDGFYDGTIFHRVIENFMIQGGGFNADMKQAHTRKPIKNEADNGLKNDKYTVAMARMSDPHSASAQFFINVKDNTFLNHTAPTQSGWGYAVFGKVVDGFDVVDAIAKVATGNKGQHGDVPLETIIVTKAVIAD